MTETTKKHGGAREGSGRKATKHVTTMVRFVDQTQKDKYLALGGNTWLKRMLDATNIAKVAK